MPITQPTIDDFQDTTVMRVIRKVVNYLVGLVPKINDEIDNLNMVNEEALAQQNAKISANTQDITTNTQGIANNTQSISAIEANVEALNKELPSEIRVNYVPSTGNFNIDYVKEDGDVLTSNTVVIVSGSTGEVTIVQNTSGISINGTAIQSATTAQPGLMTPALVSSLNNVNDTTNDHTTILNAQAEAITALDDRVDALEQGGSGGAKELYTGAISELISVDIQAKTITIAKEFDIEYIHPTSGRTRVTVSAGIVTSVASTSAVCFGNATPLYGARTIDVSAYPHMRSYSIVVASEEIYVVQGANFSGSVDYNERTMNQITTTSVTNTSLGYRLYV